MQEKKNHLIGIVQGRLSKSPKNRLQYFPKKFIDEFDIAKNIGFNYIEFFSERKLNINNPIWNNKLKENYLILSKKNNLQVITFCDDYIISNSILKNKTFYYLKNLITKIFKLKIKNLILPMYGKSLMSDLNYKKYIKTLKLILTINKKINIFLESNISPEVFSELKKQIKTKRIKFLFDTGNRSTLKRDLYADIINFGSNLGHVHIKDKNNNKINVQLGKGKVNFSKVFKNLKKINYKGNFTLETPRGSSFLNSAKKNFIFVKTLKHNNLMN